MSKHKGWWSEWSEFWINRSWIGEVTGPNASEVNNEKSALQRYLQGIQARQPFPIKFNGMLFTAQRDRPDYNKWGGLNWWQNARMPYYSMFASGDSDMVDAALFQAFRSTFEYAKMKTQVYYPNMTGPVAYWDEYNHPLLGSTHPMSYGCGREGRALGLPVWYSLDPPNHYNLQGGLDLGMLILDHFAWTGDAAALARNLPVVDAVVNFYAQWRPERDDNGKMVLFPSQALETWICFGYENMKAGVNCTLNDMPTVAGLRAVVARLEALPSEHTTAEQRRRWHALREVLPPLPLTQARSGGRKLAPCEACGEGPSNFENADLYAVHPYRCITAKDGGENLEVARAAYRERRFTSDEGWNQNVMDAALLGLAMEAKEMLIARAAYGPPKGYRFSAFGQQLQDWHPSLDHYSVMRNALTYMLLQPVDNSEGDMLLFPAWPCDWDVSVKLWGPRRTVIHAEMVGGVVTDFRVDPPSRNSSVRVLPCQVQSTSTRPPPTTASPSSNSILQYSATCGAIILITLLSQQSPVVMSAPTASTSDTPNVVHGFLGALAEAATASIKGDDAKVPADRAMSLIESLNNATVKPQWATLLFPVLGDLLQGLRKEMEAPERVALLSSHPVWGALIDFVFNTAVLSGTPNDLLSASAAYRKGTPKKVNTTRAAVDAGVELLLTFSASAVLRAAPLRIVSSGSSEDPAARLWRLLGAKDTSEFSVETRLWLLPLIRTTGGCGCQLSDWVTIMLPAAVFVNNVAKSNESVDPTRARKLFTVVEQLWEILPSMIDGCVDLPQALTMQNSVLGKTVLGAATTRNQRTPEVQESALRAMRVLGEECSRRWPDRDQSAPREVLAVGDKFINPLCAMYMGESSVKLRDLLVEAITAVAKSCCTLQVLQTVFTNVTKQLVQESQKDSTDVVSDLSELCLALLPAVPASGRQLVVGKVFTPLMMKNSSARAARLQKAAYRATRIAVEAGDFSNTVEALLELLSTVPSSAQTIKHRLLLARSLLQSVEGEQEKPVLAALIPEAMVATRDPGAQVRILGWTLLTDACRRCAASGDSLLALINIVCAGLAGTSVDMVCASVETLGLVVEQCWPMDGDVSTATASNPFAASAAPSESTQRASLLREVVKTVMLVRADGRAIEKPLFKSLLLFTRSCLRVGDGQNAECLQMYHKLTLSAEGRNQMQLKMGMRRLMEKLGKRVGWAELAAATPEEHRPLVKHVQKQLERERRRRIMERSAAAAAGDERKANGSTAEGQSTSDESSEDEGDERRRVTKRSTGKANFIIDEAGDEPLDLLGHGGQKGVRESDGKRRKSALGSEMLKEESGKIIVEVPEEAAGQKKSSEKLEETAPKKKGLGRLAEIRAAKKGARRARLQHDVKGLDQCAPGAKNRGSGDAQRQAAVLQPYAYVRLNPKLVKEKFKSESIRSIDRVVKAGEEEKKKARIVSKKSKLSISKSNNRGKRRR
ncbi:hypothetical protein FOZ61_008730 [Perkinsus olseni]|uniref:RRP12 HEAT domain-containing protein n=1 Tax=Perkinsus olseni TaxID=32597 RepID=A0A7J6L3G9_PEROL|nr:hypothetical protein FOZ61_008730 [Perkinsus olseni]KAF4655667.1 hypothetical protein FOL46_008142 [Perkinsus olseni]